MRNGRQNGASSAACVAEGAKSVLYARQKQTGAVYCCCRECFLKGFCASVCFSRVLRIGARQAQAYAAAFHSGRQGCSTHGTSKTLRGKGRVQNGRLPALSTRRGLCRDKGQRYAILQTVLQIVTNCGAALQKKHVAGKYNLQNRKHFNGGASRRLGLQGGRNGARKEEYEGTEHIRSRR